MKRLTEHFGGYIRVNGCTSLYGNNERKGAPMSNAIIRLAAYEDTGLEPEEIALAVLALMGRELAQIAEIEDIPLERLIELTRAEKDNGPLTIEELREMDQKKWLWIEVLIPNAFRRTESGYYQVHKDYTKGEAFCCGWPATIHEFEYADYGKTWLAYRRKPEEGTS